jgi:hypothetical protein
VVLLLVVGLTVMYSYAGCQQIHSLRTNRGPEDRIEAVDAIRTYVERIEEALKTTPEDGPHRE